MIFRSDWRTGILMILAVVSLTIVLLLVSPLILLIPAIVLDVNWRQLTDIGQSYTGIAAVLSAAALVGIVASIRFQAEQTRLLRRQLTREMQFNLLDMAMSDPHYAAIFRISPTQGYDAFRKAAFQNLWVRYLEFAYLTGEMSEEELRSIFEGFFTVADNRVWFDSGRQHLPRYASGLTAKGKRFLQILEESRASSDQVSASE